MSAFLRKSILAVSLTVAAAVSLPQTSSVGDAHQYSAMTVRLNGVIGWDGAH